MEQERRHSILIVDDEEPNLNALKRLFWREHTVLTATRGEEGLRLLEETDVALIIADQRMPGMSGVEMLERTVDKHPNTIRMILTAYTDVEDLMEAINTGQVYRYITKPWDPKEMRITVRRALESYELRQELDRRLEELSALNAKVEEARRKLQEENVYLRGEVKRTYQFENIIGNSPAMDRVYALLEKVIETDTTVLLLGETGTGKELIARAIHYNGPRKDKRFVAQNCGAVTESLLESELFGHRKGAFTGAVTDKKGLFEMADGGTVFLDEVGETSPSMQVRLLRVLQDGEIRPVGSTESKMVDVRVISATHTDLEKAVREGRFREDLHYRLSVFPIAIPPLRERREDISLLAMHFLREHSKRMRKHVEGFSREAMDALVGYAFPGNVRELENEIERAVTLAGDGDVIRMEDLSPKIREIDEYAAATLKAHRTLNEATDHLKELMIREALEQCGSKMKAAERLGITRQSLQQMIKRLKIG